MDARRELRGHELCGCESGARYRDCCLPKNIRWHATRTGEDEELSKTVALTERARDALLRQKARREKDLGRPLRPGDNIFGPGDIPATDKDLADELRAAGLPEHLAYAVEKTGLLLLTEESHGRAAPGDLQEWLAAINEYRAKHPEAGGGPTSADDQPVAEREADERIGKAFYMGDRKILQYLRKFRRKAGEVGPDGGRRLFANLEKFGELHRLTQEAGDRRIDGVLVSAPEVLGDTYEEIVMSLEMLANADLSLNVVPASSRDGDEIVEVAVPEIPGGELPGEATRNGVRGAVPPPRAEEDEGDIACERCGGSGGEVIGMMPDDGGRIRDVRQWCSPCRAELTGEMVVDPGYTRPDFDIDEILKGRPDPADALDEWADQLRAGADGLAKAAAALRESGAEAEIDSGVDHELENLTGREPRPPAMYVVFLRNLPSDVARRIAEATSVLQGDHLDPDEMRLAKRGGDIRRG